MVPIAVRNESVRISLVDDFSSKALRMAGAAALLRKSVDDLDGHAFRANQSVGDLGGDALPKVEKGARQADRSINQLTGRLRLLTDAFLTLGPATVPLGASLVPALSAVTLGLGVAVTAAGTAALAFVGMGDAMSSLADYKLEPTAENLQKVRVEMEKLGPAGEEFVRHLSDLEPQLRTLQYAAREGMLPGLTESIDAAVERLPAMRDFVQDFAETIGDLTLEGTEGLLGPKFEEFFDYMESDAAPTLEQFARSMGNFGEGFANILVGLAPATRDFSGGMLEMSRSFAEWSRSLDSNEAFQEFVDYVRESGPIALDFIGSLIEALAGFVEAAAPIGQATLPVLTEVLDIFGQIAGTDIGTTLLAGAAGMAAFSRASTGFQRLGQNNFIGKNYVTPIRELGKSAPTLGQVGTYFAQFGQSAEHASKKTLAARDSVRGFIRDTAPLGKTAALVGGLAVASTGAADSIGLTNSVSLGLMGTFAGPWGAAIGTAAGAMLDMKAAADGLEESMEAADAAIETQNYKQMRVELRSLRDEFDAVSDREDTFGGFIKGIPKILGDAMNGDFIHSGEISAKIMEVESALSKSAGGADLFGASIAMTGEQLRMASGDARAFSGALAELGGWLDKREAFRNYREAIDGLRDGLKKSFTPETAGQIDAVGRNIMAVASQIKDKSLRADFLQGARKSLEELARNAGPKGAAAVEKLIAKLDELGLTRPKPKIDADTKAATAKTQAIQKLVDKYGMTRAQAKALLENLASPVVAKIKGDLASIPRSVTTVHKISRIYTGGPRSQGGGANYDPTLGGLVPQADGGSVPKTGLPYADRHPYLLADGEEITSNRRGQADAYRPVLKAINADLPRHIIKGMLAEGGTVGRLASGGTARPVMGFEGSLEWATAAQAAGYDLARTFGNLADLNKRERRELEQRLKVRERVAQRELKMAEDMLSARKDELKALRDSRKAMKEQVAGNFMSDVFGDIDITSAAREGLVGSSVMQQVHAWGQAQQQAGVEMDGNPSDWIEAYLATLPRDQRDAIVNGVRGNMLNRNTLEADRFQQALEKLRALGLDGGAFQALAESGNLSAAQFYAGQSREQIDQFEQQYRTRGATALGLGNMAAGAQYDKQIKVAETQVEVAREARRDAAQYAQRMERRIDRLERLIERLPEKTGDAVGKANNNSVSHGQRSGK